MVKIENDLMTSKEACQYLGVKPQTLYAYVSRGLVRAEKDPTSLSNLYWRSDIESLRLRSRARSGHGPTAASALHWGEPILESAVSTIQNGMLYFRGYSIFDLVRSSIGFEAVAELLWSGQLPQERITWEFSATPKMSDTTQRSRKSAIGHVFSAMSSIAEHDDALGGEPIDLTLQRARQAVQLVAAVCLATRPKHSSASLTTAERLLLARGQKPTTTATEAIEAAFIVSADHELNASTFATRIAASTGAGLYSCFFAGLGAFAGRLHGLSPLDVYEFVERCRKNQDVKTSLRECQQRRLVPPGFGHTMYLKQPDPRAMVLLEIAQKVFGVSKNRLVKDRLTTIAKLIKEAKTTAFGPPNVDVGLVAVTMALDLPANAAAMLFLIGRMAGWTAHVLEQRQQNSLLRPRARYIGRAPILMS